MSQLQAGSKHELVVGLAIDSLLTLPADQKFDLVFIVFIDANTSEYKRYAVILSERDSSPMTA